MPSVSFTQKEFDALFGVIVDLNERGELEDAVVLDGLAKKMSTASARASGSVVPGFAKATSEARAGFEAHSPLETIANINKKLAAKKAAA